MKKYKIPGNPKFKVFESLEGVREFLEELNPNIVVKPDGLTGGKGVKVQGDHFQAEEEAYKYCEEILKEHKSSLKKIIIIGSLIPAVTYLIFIIAVFGVTGLATTPEGLVGLNKFFGGGITRLGFIFGLIATFTSFITLGITLKKVFHYPDFNHCKMYVISIHMYVFSIHYI